MTHWLLAQPPLQIIGQLPPGGVGSRPQSAAHAPDPLHTVVSAHSLSGSVAPTIGEHVPLSPAEVAEVHDSHTPLHAVSQQTPSAHEAATHSVGEVHGSPFILSGTQLPPLTIGSHQVLGAGVQSPALLQAAQVPPEQNMLWQSLYWMHVPPLAQPGHSPPQSTSVSPPS